MDGHQLFMSNLCCTVDGIDRVTIFTVHKTFYRTAWMTIIHSDEKVFMQDTDFAALESNQRTAGPTKGNVTLTLELRDAPMSVVSQGRDLLERSTLT